ncbi:MAG: arginine biosynthesis bifunctional protein ArgJ [Mycobacterium sp.]|nr:arginine biosynthesis bifunctional protein ArgJ [Mycobacterium sp.]
MSVLPEGFTSLETEGTRLIVCSGPRNDAAGLFGGEAQDGAGQDGTDPARECPDVLWTRQVLTTQRLTAVALAPSVFDRGPEGFADVHELAERIAAALGLGAIDVGVIGIGAAAAQLASVPGDGYVVTATVAAEEEATSVVLTTDAQLGAGAMTDVLATLPHTGVRLMLGSGASAATPAVDEVAALATTAYAHALALHGAAS